ncbi:MAG: hypothetical protein IT489_09220 [Gammaproteobacteria bacterium]|nr:hypothetical protein [Gammaproteobacteria bacterium]
METSLVGAEAAGGGRAFFRSKRIFYHNTLDTASSGWCFTVRGGLVYGPFETQNFAERMLAGLIEKFKRAGDTGGR